MTSVSALLTSSVFGAAAAAPTPIPGGANQLAGVSGPLHATLFNGHIRIKKMSLRAATAADMDLTNGPGVVFACLVSNGEHATHVGYLGVALIDTDGVALDGNGPKESNYVLTPGGVARQTFTFSLTNGFAPVKILITEKANNGPVFRVTLKPGDLPS